jgi:hypothetical protein
MANRKGIKKTQTARKPRRTSNVELTEEQLQSLIKLWKGYHGGDKGFAAKMAQIENSGEDAALKAKAAKVKALHRIEDRDIGVSQAIFKTIAELYGITTEELKAKISAPSPDRALPYKVGPWVTDEEVLKEYRVVLHGYYITKQGEDYFWMYKPIDFTTPYKGCLHAVIDYGIKRTILYDVYAYVFQQMLVVISHNQERSQRESVGLYHDFRRNIREHVGHFGFLLTEDWNSDIGLGGSLLLREPFEGTAKHGRQSPTMCKRLTQYWKDLDGERCNRLLHLFGFGPFSRSHSEKTKRKKPVSLSKRLKRK